jgi:hypothetical protein
MLCNGVRLPKAVTAMCPMQNLDLPETEEEFTLGFLRLSLGVSQCAVGWYSKRITKGRSVEQDHHQTFIFCMILEGDYDPLLPRVPDQHGARISAFLQRMEDKWAVRENLKYIPLFIRLCNRGYRYFGTYREARRDRLASSEMWGFLNTSESIGRGRWGGRDKPRWAIEAIRKAWPKRRIGWLDVDETSIIRYSPGLEEEPGEPLKCPISYRKAEKVTAQGIFQAFSGVGSLPIFFHEIVL